MSAEGARPTAAQPTRPPQPVYPLYSWRSRSESARLAYIRDHRVADMEISNLVKGPLGFDLEWRPNFRKGQPENPVALIQLSTQDTVLLIQVTSMTEFPTKLRELLGNSQWIKAGVGIKYDCQKLYNDYGVSTRNCVDLSLLARSVDNGRWKGKYTNPLGLSRLLETYENRSLAKGKVTRSNWELNLSPIQQEYAANDAHAGYVIYTRLIAMAQAMVNIPIPIYYSFSIVNGALRDHSGNAEWSPQNPFYDPGPPPPPKEHKPRNPKDMKESVPKLPSTGAPTTLSSTLPLPRSFMPQGRGPTGPSGQPPSRFISSSAAAGGSTHRSDTARRGYYGRAPDRQGHDESRTHQSSSNDHGPQKWRRQRRPTTTSGDRNVTNVQSTATR